MVICLPHPKQTQQKNFLLHLSQIRYVIPQAPLPVMDPVMLTIIRPISSWMLARSIYIRWSYYLSRNFSGY